MTTTTSPLPPKNIIRCVACHSERVLRDARACWSYEHQEWELSQTFDQAYCKDCEGDCTLEEATDDAV